MIDKKIFADTLKANGITIADIVNKIADSCSIDIYNTIARTFLVDECFYKDVFFAQWESAYIRFNGCTNRLKNLNATLWTTDHYGDDLRDMAECFFNNGTEVCDTYLSCDISLYLLNFLNNEEAEMARMLITEILGEETVCDEFWRIEKLSSPDEVCELAKKLDAIDQCIVFCKAVLDSKNLGGVQIDTQHILRSVANVLDKVLEK